MKLILVGPKGSGKTTLAYEIIGSRKYVRTVELESLETISDEYIILMDNVPVTRRMRDAILRSRNDVIVTSTSDCDTIADVHVFHLAELPLIVDF